ncbi:hypothetical protein BCR44DRAFT_1441407 [Catenaria anguillulae PL171]|uniref:Uncharacterized protein n=1 Tax=Catenaria anguillulae PL171 TaxID=765915 RepID=A0A1Y2HB43_9FUNG|nr:hypothetical protein BCR44DRAFT_1441407 [Catenaria anguillulae PL171]
MTKGGGFGWAERWPPSSVKMADSSWSPTGTPSRGEVVTVSSIALSTVVDDGTWDNTYYYT